MKEVQASTHVSSSPIITSRSVGRTLLTGNGRDWWASRSSPWKHLKRTDCIANVWWGKMEPALARGLPPHMRRKNCFNINYCLVPLGLIWVLLQHPLKLPAWQTYPGSTPYLHFTNMTDHSCQACKRKPFVLTRRTFAQRFILLVRQAYPYQTLYLEHNRAKQEGRERRGQLLGTGIISTSN